MSSPSGMCIKRKRVAVPVAANLSCGCCWSSWPGSGAMCGAGCMRKSGRSRSVAPGSCVRPLCGVLACCCGCWWQSLTMIDSYETSPFIGTSMIGHRRLALLSTTEARLRREVDTHLQWLHTQSRHLVWAAIKAMPKSRASHPGASRAKDVRHTCWKVRGVPKGQDRCFAKRERIPLKGEVNRGRTMYRSNRPGFLLGDARGPLHLGHGRLRGRGDQGGTSRR